MPTLDPLSLLIGLVLGFVVERWHRAPLRERRALIDRRLRF
jgi:hypothetical protein